MCASHILFHMSHVALGHRQENRSGGRIMVGVNVCMSVSCMCWHVCVGMCMCE